MDNAILRVVTRNDLPREKKKTGGNIDIDRFPAFNCTRERSCGAGARKRRKDKHVLVSIDTSQYIVFREKGTYRSQTCCIRGPPRATELYEVGQGCSRAMVGAQLSLVCSSATRNGEYGNIIDLFSQIVAVCAASQDGG